MYDFLLLSATQSRFFFARSSRCVQDSNACAPRGDDCIIIRRELEEETEGQKKIGDGKDKVNMCARVSTAGASKRLGARVNSCNYRTITLSN